MAKVLTLLLSHQPERELRPVLILWQQLAGDDSILLAYGGTEAAFGGIAWPHKMFIADPRLRTRDHQRERQSCTAVLHAAHQWLNRHAEFDFVYFTEFDHLPLVIDLYERMTARLRDERADVLAFHLQRIDGTSHPHYLYHAADPAFHKFLSEVTRRSDPAVVLSMLGTGSFWTREAFQAVGARAEPFPMYSEVYVPTLAHHLGFRLRDFAEQGEFVRATGEFGGEISAARERGAWTLHPVKNLPANVRLLP